MHSSLLRFSHRLFLGLGIGALTYAGGAMAYAGIYQRYESWRFEKAVVAAESLTAAVEEETAGLQDGDVIGRLEIPRIGISVIVLQGLEENTLLAGASHVPGTPSPGGDGNVVIAAHRDTFFRKLEGILPGDAIQIATIRQTYKYIVDGTEIVDPEDTRPMESRDRSELTLITCFPFYYVGSAPKRFIVHAHPQ